MFTQAIALVSAAIIHSSALHFGFLFKVSYEDMNTGKLVPGCTAFKIADDKFITARHCTYSRFLITNSQEVLVPTNIHISSSAEDNSATDWAVIETSTASKFPSIQLSSDISLDQETLLIGYENAHTLQITHLEGLFIENTSWGAFGYSYYGMSGSPILQQNHAVGVFSSFSPDENMAFGKVFTPTFIAVIQ